MLIILTGPSGAGKTTLSENLALSFERAVNIDLDVIKHFIVKGFKYDESLEGKKQWQLLGEVASVMIKSYLDQDYIVVVNGYVAEHTWDEIFKVTRPSSKFLLLPDEVTNVMRDNARISEVAMGQEAVLRHREYFLSSNYFDDFLKVDTSDESIELSLSKLKQYLKAT